MRRLLSRCCWSGRGRSAARRAPRPRSRPATGGGSGGASFSVTGAGGEVVVDVTGAVRRPGVYRMPAGSRVEDAIAGRRRRRAAGRRWKRSTWRRGSPTASRWSCRRWHRAGAPSRRGGEEGPISLGTATAEQLEEIEGIGPVTAGDIIEFRDEHGGLSSIDQLDQVPGIGPATMESLRARLQP